MTHKIIEVIGAGEVRISESCQWSCGGKKGFSLDFKLIGQDRFAGGVLPKKEAIELAKFILENAKS